MICTYTLYTYCVGTTVWIMSSTCITNKSKCIFCEYLLSCKVQFSWIFRKSRDFDRNVTFTSFSAVTRKWNVAGVYLHLLYNMRSKQVNFTITKFCLCLIIQKSSFCSQNSNVYIWTCKRACIFLVTVWRHTTLRPMLFLWFSWL